MNPALVLPHLAFYSLAGKRSDEMHSGAWFLVAVQAIPLPQVDLLARAPECQSTGSSDVVVCGRRDQNRYRIPKQYRDSSSEERGLGQAEAHIGKIGVGAVTEQGNVGGITTNRVMIRIKIPF